MISDGWILDAYIEDEYAYVWFKTVEGKAVPLKERYHPDFYLIPRVDGELDDLSQLVATHPSVVSTSTQRRYVSIDSTKKERVLRVMVDRVDKLKTAIRDVENLRRHKAIGNLELPHVQRYLMGRDLPPTRRIRVEYDSSNSLKGHQASRGMSGSSNLPPSPP